MGSGDELPDKRIHLYYDLLFARRYNLSLNVEEITQIEAIIDHPRSLAENYKKMLVECCSHPALEAAYAGLRVKGAMSHDWRSRLGRRLLYNILKCLFGEEAVLIAMLHFALDDLWERKPLDQHPEIIIRFLSDRGLLRDLSYTLD